MIRAYTNLTILSFYCLTTALEIYIYISNKYRRLLSCSRPGHTIYNRFVFLLSRVFFLVYFMAHHTHRRHSKFPKFLRSPTKMTIRTLLQKTRNATCITTIYSCGSSHSAIPRRLTDDRIGLTETLRSINEHVFYYNNM